MAAMLLVLRRRGVGLSRVSITPMAGSKPTRPRAPRKPTSVDIEAAGVGIRADEALNAVEALGDRSGRQGLSDLDRIEAATDVALKFAGVVLRLRAVEGAI